MIDTTLRVEPLSAEDAGKALAALDKIEAAQNLINAAAQDLCPVDGFVDEWSAAGPVHQAVKDYWYLVERRLSALLNRPRVVP